MSDIVPEVTEESPPDASHVPETTETTETLIPVPNDVPAPNDVPTPNDEPTPIDEPTSKDVPTPNDEPTSKDVPTPNDEPTSKDEPAPNDEPTSKDVPTPNDETVPVPVETSVLTVPSPEIQIVVSEDIPDTEAPVDSIENGDEILEKGEGEVVESQSDQIETQPTLTDIREEAEPPPAEQTTKSLDNVDYAEEPIITVTSVINLSEEGEIPEIRPSTPEAADQVANSVEAEGEHESDNLDGLLEELKLLKEEEEKFSNENAQLQHRLVEHFRSKRADERLGTAGEAERERGVTDYEQRYDKYISVLQDRQSEARKMREYSDQLLKSACDTEREMASELAQVVSEEGVFKQETMVSAVDSRTGKHMSAELMERLLRDETKKEAEVGNIRLENIKLSRNLAKREEQLRQKEEVAEGLHKIEFEQLKIEHQKNNERIEDRNEDINRLRGKITRTVQVLTHVKEKQHFVASENTLQSEQLADSDIQVALMRDRLTYIKQNRDRLRADSQRLQDKGGLVNHRKLLRDLEEKQDLSEELESRLKQLKKRHAELSQLSDGIKQKISQTKASGSLSMLQVPH